MEFSLASIISLVIYVALGVIALWGAFCVIVVLRRVAQIRFRSEAEQDEFLDKIDETLARADFDATTELCDVDERAMSQQYPLNIVPKSIFHGSPFLNFRRPQYHHHPRCFSFFPEVTMV